MTDIVERLHNLIECEMDKAQCELYATAANEIEKLRAYSLHERSLGAEGPMIELAKNEIERLRAEIDGDLVIVKLKQEIKRLRKENDELLNKAMRVEAERDIAHHEIERLKHQ